MVMEVIPSENKLGESVPPVVETVEQPAIAGVEAPPAETAFVGPEIPVLVPAVEPSPKEKPAVEPGMQEYIARLERQAQTAQEQENFRVLESTIAQYAQVLEEQQGLTPEQALFIAKREGDQLYRQYQSEQFRRGQINAALAIGKELGVDPGMLMNLPTPDAMRAAAQAATAQNTLATENARLKAELAALKKGSVPAQSFASGAVSGDGGRATASNIDDLWVRFDREHPSEPNPYDVRYRTFLRTGQI